MAALAASFFAGSSPGSTVLANLQQQVAERNADQAAQRARALASEAQKAQVVADRAQEKAQDVQGRSDRAQGDADEARRSVVARDTVVDSQASLSRRLEQVIERPPDPPPVNETVLAPVVNAYGQSTGVVVNVTA